MLLDNNYNSTCKFAEDVVAYLYGEIETSEKLRFEKHLADCQSCADELAGFSLARSSILEWRNQEFTPLATPVIEIPFEKRTEVHNFAIVVEKSPSLFTRIRDFFYLSPKWMPLATGFAVFAICSGLIFIAIKSQIGTTEIAQTNTGKTSNVKVNTSPVVESKTTETNSSTTTTEDVRQTPVDKPAVTKSNVLPNTATPTKISMPPNPVKTNSVKSPKIISNNGNNPAIKTPTKTSKKSRRPTLSGDDDEDNSLRLSDLLEEISLR
jgi:Putative zinc-finger